MPLVHGSRLIVDQMPVMGDPNRVQLTLYPGGHMFYAAPGSQASFRSDVMNLYHQMSLLILAAIGAMADPCAQVAAAPPELVAYQAAQAKAAAEGKPAPPPLANLGAIYNAWSATRREQDFADHCKYAAANAALPEATAKRVVFFGDSITEIWSRLDPALFEGDVVNRGISGQTTAQMVGRFQQDVIALKPAVVHIMAGTNDMPATPARPASPGSRPMSAAWSRWPRPTACTWCFPR